MNRTIKFRALEYRRQPLGNKMEYAMVYGYEHYLGEADIKKLPLMQFTGLLDKFETEIFEGDIIETRIGSVCEVVYAPPSFKIKYSSGETKPLLAAIANGSHVIGNIHQHPELLKDKIQTQI